MKHLRIRLSRRCEKTHGTSTTSTLSQPFTTTPTYACHRLRLRCTLSSAHAHSHRSRPPLTLINASFRCLVALLARPQRSNSLSPFSTHSTPNHTLQLSTVPFAASLPALARAPVSVRRSDYPSYQIWPPPRSHPTNPSSSTSTPRVWRRHCCIPPLTLLSLRSHALIHHSHLESTSRP